MWHVLVETRIFDNGLSKMLHSRMNCKYSAGLSRTTGSGIEKKLEDGWVGDIKLDCIDEFNLCEACSW